MKLEILKEIINYKLNADIDNKSRKRHNVYCKKLFCKIAYDISIKNTFEAVGAVINLKHDNTMFHYKSFDTVYENYKQEYNNIVVEFNLEIPLIELEPVKIDYTNNVLLDEIKVMLSGLSDSKLLEFRDYRVKPFLKLNANKVSV